MKFNDVSFPHPVLGISDTVSGVIDFTDELLSDKDTYHIKFELVQNNDDLNRLLAENKLEYFCEVTCTNTLYRKVFTSLESTIDFDLPKKQVKGKVEFTCLLVSKCDIPGYVNEDAHSDYLGFTFDIDIGDILAVFGKYSFNADIKYERLKAVSEILTVIPTDEFEVTNINLDSPKIEVQMPENDYEKFAGSYSGDEKYIPIFHSSVVLNALLVALYNLNNYSDKFWAKAISYRLNEKEFENLDIKESENIPEIAQRLLGNPLNRLLVGIDNLEEHYEND
jgi:hypothetical protein